VPIISGSNVLLGVLDIDSDVKGVFTTEDMAGLETICSLLQVFQPH
jgi:putative methionine-R-sulfoxide reductase with GAF domain